MESKLVKSTLNATLFLGAILTLVFLQTGLKQGLSLAGGVIFSILNLSILWKLIQETITSETRSKSNIAVLVIFKFIVVWGAFVALLAINILDPIFFAIGFTNLLLVFSLKGFGQWIAEYYSLNNKDLTKKDTDSKVDK